MRGHTRGGREATPKGGGTARSLGRREILERRCKAIIERSTIDPGKVIENALRAQMEFTEIRRVPSDEVAVNNILNVHPASWNAPSALTAKAHSAIKGLALLANLGFRDVIVETDSKLLINGINGDFRNKVWSIMPILEELHRISVIGVRVMELESWVSRPPLSLVQVLVSDGLPCPP
ncbi:unnamed protein product [Prunus armeniaca]